MKFHQFCFHFKTTVTSYFCLDHPNQNWSKLILFFLKAHRHQRPGATKWLNFISCLFILTAEGKVIVKTRQTNKQSNNLDYTIRIIILPAHSSAANLEYNTMSTLACDIFFHSYSRSLLLLQDWLVVFGILYEDWLIENIHLKLPINCRMGRDFSEIRVGKKKFSRKSVG